MPRENWPHLHASDRDAGPQRRCRLEPREKPQPSKPFRPWAGRQGMLCSPMRWREARWDASPSSRRRIWRCCCAVSSMAVDKRAQGA